MRKNENRTLFPAKNSCSSEKRRYGFQALAATPPALEGEGSVAGQKRPDHAHKPHGQTGEHQAARVKRAVGHSHQNAEKGQGNALELFLYGKTSLQQMKIDGLTGAPPDRNKRPKAAAAAKNFEKFLLLGYHMRCGDSRRKEHSAGLERAKKARRRRFFYSRLSPRLARQHTVSAVCCTVCHKGVKGVRADLYPAVRRKAGEGEGALGARLCRCAPCRAPRREEE